MDILFLTMLLAMGAHLLKVRYQAGRMALLGRYLAQFQIEKLMETLTQGYLRALGEADEERRGQIWSLLSTAEVSLYEQFKRFATDLARLTPLETRVSKLPIAIAYADQLFPRSTFDLRAAMQIHAQGIEAVARNDTGRSPRDKAFTLTAELFLMQHTCHWFCKSRTIASARLLGRHQTSYEQVLAAVSPATRKAYQQLLVG
ncbi:hypothetical protein [Simplicispira psychrophila]|uniref:hypothetical protein n=1 Tax=Simplicispira psychrophila TaxID=80882 RepID=UPI0004807C45|nr:hypothetical protein [Simplicispira psychrophila]